MGIEWRGGIALVLGLLAPQGALAATECSAWDEASFRACVSTSGDVDIELDADSRIAFSGPVAVSGLRTITVKPASGRATLAFTPAAEAGVWDRIGLNLFTVGGDVTLWIERVDFELPKAEHASGVDLTVARAFEIRQSHVTLRDCGLEDVVGLRVEDVVDDVGGYLAHLSGEVEAVLVLEGGTYQDNRAVAARGGLVYVRAEGQLELRDQVVLARNEARSGGVVHLDYGGTLLVDGTTGVPEFVDNEAWSGGAISMSGATARIDAAWFHADTALDPVVTGGFIATEASDLRLGEADAPGKVRFQGGRAGRGGAVYAASLSSLTVHGAEFDANQATGNGGAIYVEGGQVLHVDSASFRSNQAREGSAIYVEGVMSDSETVLRSSFCGNASTDAPSGVAHFAAHSGTPTPLVWRNNLVDGAGGTGQSLSVSSREYHVERSTFLRSDRVSVYVEQGTGRDSFSHNLVGWGEGAAGLLAASVEDLPNTAEHNLFYTQAEWLSPVRAGVQRADLGEAFANPRLTGVGGTERLGEAACTVPELTVRPDGPSYGFRDWADEDLARDRVIGFMGGDGAEDRWWETHDPDEVPLIFDCDDADGAVLAEVPVWLDADGDGAGDPDSPIDMMRCGPLPGESLDDLDCDDTNPAITDLCRGVSWYGGCASSPAPWSPLLVGLALLLLRRRR